MRVAECGGEWRIWRRQRQPLSREWQPGQEPSGALGFPGEILEGDFELHVSRAHMILIKALIHSSALVYGTPVPPTVPGT